MRSPGEPSPPRGAFTPADRRAVYHAIELRRDIRNFRPDAVPDEVLLRILRAAHRAGSVGMMQPWDFVLVRSTERRAEIYELFRRANDRAATRWEGDRRARYAALKLQGILDAPLSVCITCDTLRGGPHVLGRDTIRETDVYSTCLAVQNFWLAARAEGVGVGWVSIVDPAELAACLALPDGVIPIAFLCVGYPVEFPDTPLLEATGWRERDALAEHLHFDGWGGTGEGDAFGTRTDSPSEGASPAVPPEQDAPPQTLDELLRRVRIPDPDGARAVRICDRLDQLTKPRGSLGRLEGLAVRLARIQGRDQPTARRKRLLLFAGDHGVCAEGVSAYRPELTARLCYNAVAGGAAINALARGVGAEVTVVDVGVNHEFGGATGIEHRKVRRGTRNLANEDALTRDEAVAALLAGAHSALAVPCDVLALGEVGIGNTTAAAALLALLTEAEARDVVGRGTGVGAETLRRKTGVVERALARCRGRNLDTLGKLAAIGGLEIAALAGAILGAASRRTPVVLDGFITGVAALVAKELAPASRGYLVVSHCSAERGHRTVLEQLGFEPLLELELRLGEGSGAALALPLLDAACALLRDVRTFREAGIDEPIDERGMR